jgi:ATP-dependent RNA helicase DeaD
LAKAKPLSRIIAAPGAYDSAPTAKAGQLARLIPYQEDPMSKPDAAAAAAASFSDLKLSSPLLAALQDLGYETPSPIQIEAIPHLLQGLDLLGHAPTGTGKTAAFALPLLARLDMKSPHVQVMTLTPTRELAIQVAEAFQRYAAHLDGFHVLPIYGGSEYGTQLRALKRGVHVVVGTPGRVRDHMEKGTLKLNHLQALVLDEADEMLRMGFIDEVEWILDQMPAKRQMTLFSATMPGRIQKIAKRYLNEPQQVSIKSKTATAETIRQRYWQVSGLHKLDAFTRILEVEEFDAMLVFVRTKLLTTEIADRLAARGYAAAAMNGDMAQKDREKMIEQLKNKSIDILVATDVAARGLDVKRISHVINYDIPYDAEAYIHRIGRTGRAGRKGDAILFVSPRERRMLRVIENATRQKIEPLELPTTETVNNKRIANFKQQITDTLAGGDLAFLQGLIEQYRQEHDVPGVEIAAALAKLAIGDKPLLLEEQTAKSRKQDRERERGANKPNRRERQSADDKAASRTEHRGGKKRSGKGKQSRDDDNTDRPGVNKPPASEMERFRIEVGYDHDVKPGNIVGAIANEAGLDGDHVGQIEISDQFTLVDLPKGMPKEVFRDLKKVWVCGQQLKISRLNTSSKEGKSAPRKTRADDQADAKKRSRPAAGSSDGKARAGARSKATGKSAHKSGGKKSPNKKKFGKKKTQQKK